jgi:hypothetical protein
VEIKVKGQDGEDGTRESGGDDDPGQNDTGGQKGERNGGLNNNQHNASGYKNARHLGQIPLNHKRSLLPWNLQHPLVTSTLPFPLSNYVTYCYGYFYRYLIL